MKIEPPTGATPISPDDLRDLIPSLETQDELNEFEQQNIIMAERWAASSKALKRDFPSIEGLKLLHLRMFNRTWTWAGEFRKKELSFGIEWPKISTEVKKLCGDAQYWIENQTYTWDKLAIRFHHRIVLIHPFMNGNGRHARLATELLLSLNGQEPFSWGAESLRKGSARDEYILALQEADEGNIQRLLEFARG